MPRQLCCGVRRRRFTEDDEKISDLVKLYLEKDGFGVVKFILFS